MSRQLYLVAYDIRHPKRLRMALRVVRSYALGGQKSVFECWLSPAERVTIWRQLGEIIDTDTDAALLLRLDPRARTRVLGLGQPPADPRWFYLD